MSKQKSKKQEDLLSGFQHHPHDRYFKLVLQNKEIAIQFVREFVPKGVCAAINFDTFEMDEESLVDPKFQNHFTDIAYTAQLEGGPLARLSIIFEHKSWKPENGVIYAQLNRYISNVWAKDLQQKRPLSVVLPIVVYHGETTITQDSFEVLFNNAPEVLQLYIPKFDYVLLDLTTLPNTAIIGLEQLLLQKFLLALKNARNAQFIEQNWKSFIIFASDLSDNELEERVLTATVIYLSYISQTFKQRIENMDTVLSTEEQKEVLPYIHQMYNFWTNKGIKQGIEQGIEKGIEQGIEKGIEQGIEKGILRAVTSYLRHNPVASDTEVAEIFEIDLEMVQKIRENN